MDFNFYVDPDGRIDELKRMVREDKKKKMTYGDIFIEFLSETGIDRSRVANYRPCCEMFGVPNIKGAIVVWFNGGGKLIYISKYFCEEDKKHE